MKERTSATQQLSLEDSYRSALLVRAQESSLLSDETGALSAELERILRLHTPEKERALVKFLVRTASTVDAVRAKVA